MRKFNDQYSLVRFLHAIPRGVPVDVYFNGSLFFNRILFTQFTPYIYVPEGNYEVEIFETMKVQNPIFTQNINVKSGDIATLALTGYYNDLELLFIPEDTEGSTENLSKLRIVHLSPNLPELNILLNDNIAFSKVDFRDVTNYLSLPSYQIYDLDIILSQNNRLLRSNRIAVNTDRIYSLYLLGNFANFQVFQSRDGAAFVNTVVRSSESHN